jgi:hypothetical protein
MLLWMKIYTWLVDVINPPLHIDRKRIECKYSTFQ